MQVVHVQALAGDAADAVPGVKGIGPKNASKLISQFGSVEATLSAAQDEEESIAPKLRQRLLVGFSNIGGNDTMLAG